MAEANSWPSIQKHGLLSTSALLDLFEVDPDVREQLLRRRRPDSVAIKHPVHGVAVIRDNKPLNDGKLASCLVGLQPPDWYELLNSRVFFWPTSGRLETLLAARAYRGTPHCVLTLNTHAVVRDYEAVLRLAPINTGATLFSPPKRGAFTFQRLEDFPASSHGQGRQVAEVSIADRLSSIQKYVESVEIRHGAAVLRHVWP